LLATIKVESLKGKITRKILQEMEGYYSTGVLGNKVGEHGLDSSGSMKQVAGFCEHGNEHFDSIETEIC
jgi:hypothetical protein